MCRIHTTEEIANILDTMADLFAWKRRESLAEAALAARFPSRPWSHTPPDAADAHALPAPRDKPQSA